MFHSLSVVEYQAVTGFSFIFFFFQAEDGIRDYKVTGVQTFVFQAEDGIRDYKVTGVQTCALPIWSLASWMKISPRRSITSPQMLHGPHPTVSKRFPSGVKRASLVLL